MVNVLSARSALQNHLRNGLLFRVRDRKRGIFDSELGGELSGLAVESHCGASSGHTDNFAVAPAHSVIPAGAERFHGRFFGRESRRIALHAIRFRVAVTDFSGREDALEKSDAKALNGLADARNFSDIDTSADNHDL